MDKKRHEWFQDSENHWIKANNFIELKAPDLLALAKNYSTTQHTASTKEGAWVFDLDSTLFCLTPRIRNIYLEFIRAHEKPKASWLHLLGHLTPKTQRYSIEETFQYLLEPSLGREAATAEAEELWHEFRPFWMEHFFEDRHIHHDIPYPGAQEFVKAIKSLGKKVIYLTGRDRLGSGQGTLAHLKRCGFEMTSDEILLMKPRRNDDDLLYKESAAKILKSQFEVEALIDNEAENLFMFARVFPSATIVLYHSVMSGRVPKGDFRSVLAGRSAYKLNSFI